MTEKDFFEKSLLLSNEFSRYILEHPEIDERIPEDAQIIFEVQSDPVFTKLMKEYAHKQHIKGQKVICIKLKNFPPKRKSLLTKVSIEPAYAI